MAITIRPTIPGGQFSSLTDDEIGYTLTGNYNASRIFTGDWAVHAPAGIIADTTPAVAVVDGRSTNGAMLDYSYSRAPAFDAASTGHNPANAHNPAAIIRPGSVLVKMKGIETNPPSARDGLAKQWSALHVVSTPQGANAISPAIWTGPNRPWDTVDVDSILASLPSYAATGDEVTWASLKPVIGRRDIGLASWHGVTAYQELSRFGTGLGFSNYGSYLAARLNKVRIGILSNTWSATDKREALSALIIIGYDLWRARASDSPDFASNGGHFHWEGDLILLALRATGNLASYAAALPLLGNVSKQPFVHNATTIGQLAPHNSLTLPYIYRWRAVTSVASDTQLVVAHSSTGDQEDKTRFAGGIAVRERDGAERTISTSVQVGPDSAITGWTWTFASPLTGTLLTDRFHVKPAFAVTVGTPDWCISGIATPRLINPLVTSAYRQENEWSMAHRFARALGLVGSGLAGWDAYTAHAEAGINGLPTPIHSTAAAFIAAHSAAILARPQIV